MDVGSYCLLRQADSGLLDEVPVGAVRLLLGMLQRFLVELLPRRLYRRLRPPSERFSDPFEGASKTSRKYPETDPAQ